MRKKVENMRGTILGASIFGLIGYAWSFGRSAAVAITLMVVSLYIGMLIGSLGEQELLERKPQEGNSES